MDTLLEKLYSKYNVDFHIEDIRDMIACTPNLDLYLEDIGIVVTDESISISTINNNREWIVAKLQLLRDSF